MSPSLMHHQYVSHPAPIPCCIELWGNSSIGAKDREGGWLTIDREEEKSKKEKKGNIKSRCGKTNYGKGGWLAGRNNNGKNTPIHAGDN